VPALSAPQPAVDAGADVSPATGARRLPAWWPLAGLTLLAAALRLPTLGLQSFWYDEAFTPVHVLHASLGSTLHAVVHTENTPPLWYVLIWGWSRAFGTGVVSLRFPSALAGVATVPVAWGIGRELAGRRAAIVTAGLVAVNPLLVWYSQEARAYALFVLTAALAMLCFLRAEREPTARRTAAFALTGALALLSHYFAVFLLIPMALWLARERAAWRVTLPALGALAAVGVALAPLISAQGGHGTQWIGQWALASRVQAIPQYYLTGYMGAPLGHGVELLVALTILAGVLYGLWRGLDRREERAALIALSIVACGVLIPLALALFGADYLAPRNLVAAMVPLTALLAVVIAARRTGSVGLALAGAVAVAFLAVSVDVNLSPRLQRGDWSGVARALRSGGGAGGGAGTGTSASAGSGPRTIVTAELGAAPLEYYMPPLRNLAARATATVSEIDEVGYAPLRPSAGRVPAPGFRLLAHEDVDGLVVYRFLAPAPRQLSYAQLRRLALTATHTEVLIGAEKF